MRICSLTASLLLNSVRSIVLAHQAANQIFVSTFRKPNHLSNEKFVSLLKALLDGLKLLLA
jgi:hypothetical protein